MNRTIVFVVTSAFAVGVMGSAARVAISSGQSGALVRLQPNVTGVAQTGNINVSGRVRASLVSLSGSETTLVADSMTGNGVLASSSSSIEPAIVGLVPVATNWGVMGVNQATSAGAGLGAGADGILAFAGTGGLAGRFMGGVVSDTYFQAQSEGYGLQQSANGRVLSTYLDASGGWLGTVSPDPLHFYTGNSYAHATLTVNGNFGIGTDTPGARLHVETSTGGAGVFRSFDANAGVVDSITAQSSSGNGAGIYASNSNPAGFTQGVYAEVFSPEGVSVYGQNLVTNNAGVAIYGDNPSSTGWAVYAAGRFGATGTKSFVIDHPLDPQNKVLLHYSSESPEPQNFYNGIVRTDERGYATITLPDYYEAINREPRYTLTVLDEGDSDSFVLAKVVQKVKNGQFVIRTSAPEVEVSWEIKAVRNDRWVQVKGAPTEVEKTEAQKGKYLSPELYDQPESMGTFYRRPSSSHSVKK